MIAGTHVHEAPLFAWPGRPLIRRSLALLVGIGCAWTLLYHGADQINSLHSWRVPIHFEAELSIPFWPGFTLVYSSLYIMFLAAPFALRSQGAIDTLGAALLAEVVVASVVFVLLPTETAFPTVDATQLGVWGPAFIAADLANGTTNCVPSLHVAFAMTSGWILYRGSGRIFFLAWAAAIAFSTLLTHQHHLLDVASGLLLAAFGLRVAAPQLNRWLDDFVPAAPSTASVGQSLSVSRRGS